MKNRVKKLLAKARELPCPGCGARLDQPQRHPNVAMLEDFHAEDQRRMLWLKITPEFPRGFYSDLRDADRDEPLSDDERRALDEFLERHRCACSRCGRYRFNFAPASDEQFKHALILKDRLTSELFRQCAHADSARAGDGFFADFLKPSAPGADHRAAAG